MHLGELVWAGIKSRFRWSLSFSTTPPFTILIDIQTEMSLGFHKVQMSATGYLSNCSRALNAVYLSKSQGLYLADLKLCILILETFQFRIDYSLIRVTCRINWLDSSWHGRWKTRKEKWTAESTRQLSRSSEEDNAPVLVPLPALNREPKMFNYLIGHFFVIRAIASSFFHLFPARHFPIKIIGSFSKIDIKVSDKRIIIPAKFME